MLKHSVYIAVGVFLVLVSGRAASAESAFSALRQGNSLYADGKYQDALKKYQEAQVDSPADERVMFNLGNGQYKLDEYDHALSEYLKAAQSADPKLRAESHYNAGNTLYRMGKLEEAVNEYLEALKYKPDDEDAKYNLEFVRREIRRRMNEQQERQKKKQQEQQKQNQQSKQNQSQSDQQQKERQREQQKQNQGEGKDQEKKQEQPEPRNQQPTQTPPQEKPEEAGGSNGKSGQQKAQALPNKEMSDENVERYLQAIEAQSSKNMKDFLRRQQPQGTTTTTEDW